MGSLKTAPGAGPGGFTLLEVLVSTMILAAIVYLASFSYGMFIDLWAEKKLTDLAAMNRYRYFSMLRSSVESVTNYYVTEPQKEKKGEYSPLFIGEKDSIVFVTLSSVFQPGTPALARLSVRPGETAKQLLYEEADLQSRYVKYHDKFPLFQQSLVLADNVDAIRFRFYGLLEEQWDPVSQTLVKSFEWQDVFSGKEKETLPKKIEMVLSAGHGAEKYLFPIKGYNSYKDAYYKNLQ